ncbi:hypothetical protein BUALT_Bualt11G0005900 [Buddleja alternifolia]|uniref:Pentatricopeptide repeat-containing protein n=1 Tax=Buddleja alternifolia TaxID=168488 RepID=A0AAV6WWH1_9LAMI|nr:hypothetical protein BUALT_Bualt11G0005900 [Buddleja alternifolia]
MSSSYVIPILDRFSIASWNSSIKLSLNRGDARKTLLLFRQMKQQHSHEHPNNFIFPLIAKACAKLSDLKLAQIIHARVVKTPHSSDIYVQTAMVDMYVKCSNLECGHHLFDEMPDRDVSSWNAVIMGFAQMGDFDRVSLLSNRMRIDGILPDAVTIMVLTQLMSGIKDLRLLSSVHYFGSKVGLGYDVSVANTWISGYAKCDDLFLAGFALNGKFQATLDRCNRMLKTGFQPNHVTFIAVLQACTHASLLEMGLKFFNMMIKPYKINPGLDHYSCMVDLLGRRGKFKGALKFIQEMPLQPDAGIWGALLSACKIHHNLEISEFAANQLFLLEP